MFFKTKGTKKAKTEDKVEAEESAQTPEATKNSVEEPGDGEEESEVPSLPLGLTGNPASSRIFKKPHLRIIGLTCTWKKKILTRNG